MAAKTYKFYMSLENSPYDLELYIQSFNCWLIIGVSILIGVKGAMGSPGAPGPPGPKGESCSC
jgi:hypothetical protein